MKKVLGLLGLCVLSLGMVVGCGNGSDTAKKAQKSTTEVKDKSSKPVKGDAPKTTKGSEGSKSSSSSETEKK